jgi:hypothetical protein
MSWLADTCSKNSSTAAVPQLLKAAAIFQIKPAAKYLED